MRIRLFGGFRMSVGARIVGEKEWRLKKAGSLIKLLALAPAHRMHREQIMDLLWPDLDTKAALRCGARLWVPWISPRSPSGL